MANTVITNYTDLNGPSSKSDSSVVVIVNKDGSLSVDQKLLGTLMGSDGSQAAGISVVRVGHEGKPDDATDSENEDEKIPHVTLSVDSYCDEPNSIIKYDSGAEMLQSLRIETRENSLVGFHNDHCYTSLKSPSQVEPQQNEAFTAYDDPVIEITQTPPQRSVQHNKKITILEQQIIPKGKKIIINPTEASVILKGNDILNKPLSVLSKPKHREIEKKIDLEKNHEESADSSSISSSSESAPDRDSDSDYKDAKDRSVSLKLKRSKVKPRILKNSYTMKESRLDIKTTPKSKLNRSIVKRDIREKIKKNVESDKRDTTIPNKESLSMAIPVTSTPSSDQIKIGSKQVQKVHKKEKKTPAHVTALLSDMTSLFSTPDVIRRVSTDNKTLLKQEKETVATNKKANTFAKSCETNETKSIDNNKFIENTEKLKGSVHKTYIKQNKSDISSDKPVKSFDTIPQLDDASLAQILQEPTPTPMKIQPSVSSNTNVINSPGLAGPLSPTLDLLAGLQPEEEGLTEDLLMHVAQLVESSENLQEVIDKQVLGKVDTLSKAQPPVPTLLQQPQILNNALQTPSKLIKNLLPRKDPIEIVRRDGRVITLPPIEAPATRASKRKSQVESSNSVTGTPVLASAPLSPIISTHEPALQHVSKQYVNKKLTAKKQEPLPIQTPIIEKTSAESQESWNSEDDPNRLWCICKQPHNNRFMICCDSCEDWFHGKCVNITKAMGQQMEEEGIEWRCPNCVKSTKTQNKNLNKVASATKNIENQNIKTLASPVLAKDQGSKTNCIVCKKSACASSIYCSDACILRHAQDSLGSQGILKSDEKGNVSEKLKSESRVIVYERKTGRLLAGPNAPTAENLKSWLQKNPTFEVVRPGTLSTIKPNLSRKKSLTEANKIQTTLNFEKMSKKSQELKQRLSMPEYKDKAAKSLLSLKEEIKTVAQPKTPVTPKSQQSQQALDTAKSQTTSSAGKASESRKAARTPSRSHSTVEKAQAPSVLPLTPRRKDVSESRMKLNSTEPIRDNVKKALHEQMSLRMAETSGVKFTEDEILQFAIETEFELHELFRDVGMKYKAKYRSLMFNIKDRKNLSLWQKICDRTITPQQLVRLSPEELASQELAQWRDKEAKHQLELIKKSELDLLAASKTYVLKTHKGEEVMETKESVSTELDPNVPVEDLVTALNDSMGNEQPPEVSKHMLKKTDSGSHKKYNNSKKKDKENGLSGYKSKRESKKDSESKKKSRSSRKRSENRDKELRTRRSEKKLRRSKSQSKEDSARDKTDSIENVKGRSRSRVKSKRHFKETSRSTSRGRERSRSSERSRHRSRSKEYPKHRQRSRSKHDYSTEEKVKHRSKSQENPYSKNKNDSSTDSESIERPKSAMLKETHPEYDPHEPMITSAFSEEDLRKSREDVYEDGYKNDLSEYREVDYDPSKSFSIGTSVVTPMESYITTQDKASEVESDQEPSSTVENSAPIVWNGCINMVDVARFYVAAHEVSGNSVDIEDDLSTELDVVGRINPETVWDYILKMKRAGNKDIVILRLQAANDEEKMQYIALYSYLSSRNRLGVVKVSNTATVKDFYIVPLSANSSLPPVLLPLEGPGLEVKTHLLIAIVIRQRKKRLPTNIPKEIIPTKVVRESRKRSYTPPVGNKSSYTPPASPKRRAPLPLPVAYTSPVLSTTIKDKIAATLASVEDEEAYSPGSSTSSSSAPASSTLRCKMEELNRQIEEQKQQILKMTQADSSIGTEDEAYSPSRPMTPPSVVPLADIALPSNLQEILATIKQRTETAADVDMRTLPPL